MKPKTLIIIIAVLVVLFAVAVGVGATRPSSGASAKPPAWLARPAQLFLKQQRLADADIQSALPEGCVQGLRQGVFTLPPGGSCILFVKASSESLRSLPLRLATGRAVVAFDPFGEKRMKVQRELGLGGGDKRDM